MALEPGTLADDGRGYQEVQPGGPGGLTGKDGREYAKRVMREHVVRSNPGQLAGEQVPGTLVPIDAPTSVKLADVAERHADMFNADDIAVINAAVVELQDYEIKIAAPAGAPVNVDVPFVEQVNDVLTCTMGNWENQPTSYAYQWLLNGSAVGSTVGSDPSVHAVTAADVGAVATCVVTATNGVGYTAAPPSNEVTITDPTPAAREA